MSDEENKVRIYRVTIDVEVYADSAEEAVDKIYGTFGIAAGSIPGVFVESVITSEEDSRPQDPAD